MSLVTRQKYDLAIIGGGILGTCLVFWLSRLYPQAKIVLLEKEKEVAVHATYRNTGVIHRPFYLNPLKKKIFAISSQVSYGLWKKYAALKNLPWNPVGTIEVADRPAEVEILRRYVNYCRENGMHESEYVYLEPDAARELEPGLRCAGALYCSTDTAVDFAQFARSLFADFRKLGVDFKPEFEVAAVKEENSSICLTSKNREEVNASFVINCAGGNAVKIAHLMGVALDYTDLNFRGEYWMVKEEYYHLASHNIYSVPRYPEFPFLDPHWVVGWDGKVKIGPSAVPVAGAYTYEGLAPNLTAPLVKLLEKPIGNKIKLLFNPLFLGLAAKEWQGFFSRGLMIKRLRKFLPEVNPEYLSQKGLAGVRSPVIDKAGDFVKEALEFTSGSSFHVLNFNSPGATGAPAFCARLVNRLRQDKKLDFLKPAENPPAEPWDYEEVIKAFKS